MFLYKSEEIIHGILFAFFVSQEHAVKGQRKCVNQSAFFGKKFLLKRNRQPIVRHTALFRRNLKANVLQGFRRSENQRAFPRLLLFEQQGVFTSVIFQNDLSLQGILLPAQGLRFFESCAGRQQQNRTEQKQKKTNRSYLHGTPPKTLCPIYMCHFEKNAGSKTDIFA